VCPTWDQTLVFDLVEIHGDPQSVADNPPKVIVEIFDYDSFVSVTVVAHTFSLICEISTTSSSQLGDRTFCIVRPKKTEFNTKNSHNNFLYPLVSVSW